jgi:hypothetical protein
MDPYLEGELRPEFRETLAGTIRAQLVPQVRPKCVAHLAKRHVLDRSALALVDPTPRVVYPDVHQWGTGIAAPAAALPATRRCRG